MQTLDAIYWLLTAAGGLVNIGYGLIWILGLCTSDRTLV